MWKLEELEMKFFSKKNLLAFFFTLVTVLATATIAFATGEEEITSNYYATFWALVPPLVAIALALITKEV